jgi:hypothetical protein
MSAALMAAPAAILSRARPLALPIAFPSSHLASVNTSALTVGGALAPSPTQQLPHQST